jgi:hypothetical protein
MRRDWIGELWHEGRHELAAERRRNKLDLGQAMREWELTESERGDVPHSERQREQRRQGRLHKLKHRAAVREREASRYAASAAKLAARQARSA